MYTFNVYILKTYTYWVDVMKLNIEIGDLLYRSKDLVEHAGIYIGNNQVLHNQPEEGAVITSFDKFANYRDVKVTSIAGTNHSVLAKRLVDILGNTNHYNPLTNNCEHLASFMIAGRKKSPQVQASLMYSIIAVMVGAHAQKGHWLLWATGGALVGLLTHKLTQKYDFIVNPVSA